MNRRRRTAIRPPRRSTVESIRHDVVVSLGRIAWITTVAICVVAAILLFFSDYTGYGALAARRRRERGDQPALSSASSARAARPRWLIASFSSGASSAIVRPSATSSGRNAGS